MVFVKTEDFEAAESEVKRKMRQTSASSSSHSYEVHCHVSQISFKNILSIVILELMMKIQIMKVKMFTV